MKELNFPIVCKGALKDSYIAKDKTDLLIYFDKINDMLHGGQGKVIFQELIQMEQTKQQLLLISISLVLVRFISNQLQE